MLAWTSVWVGSRGWVLEQPLVSEMPDACTEGRRWAFLRASDPDGNSTNCHLSAVLS